MSLYSLQEEKPTRQESIHKAEFLIQKLETPGASAQGVLGCSWKQESDWKAYKKQLELRDLFCFSLKRWMILPYPAKVGALLSVETDTERFQIQWHPDQQVENPQDWK